MWIHKEVNISNGLSFAKTPSRRKRGLILSREAVLIGYSTEARIISGPQIATRKLPSCQRLFGGRSFPAVFIWLRDKILAAKARRLASSLRLSSLSNESGYFSFKSITITGEVYPLTLHNPRSSDFMAIRGHRTSLLPTKNHFLNCRRAQNQAFVMPG